MRQIKTGLFLALLLLFCPTLNAFHIIGGEITYVCSGDGEYVFTMKIYRDCQGGGACFDSQTFCDGEERPFLAGTVTIFRGTQVFTGLILDEPQVTSIIPKVSNPCLIAPSNICVEEGIYTFIANLPPSNESYTISYQRCCRNATIVNIQAPAANGATYTTEIPPASQEICNSSPVFNDFPPIIICKGSDVNFDHSATDPEGDSLVYTFCPPYLGGGLAAGAGSAFGPNGVAPDPESPPPYESVNFITPYNFNRPLNTGNGPGVRIDRRTGLISGEPNVVGQFVVGVCVRAYDNGILMNEVRRDFQFNVANCQPTVFGDIEEQELREKDGRPLYYVQFCGEDAQLVNESSLESNINSLVWSFDTPNGNITSTQWDADDLVFPGDGTYFGELILNPGQLCNDTALIEVNIQPNIDADFSFDYDTCNYGAVQFTDLSVSDAGPNAIQEWDWDFKNGTSSAQQNVDFLYDEPGNYDVSLTVVDINGCFETNTKRVSFFPIPEQLIIAPSTFRGCLPANITFENLSTPINEDYDIVWNFGDGNFGNTVSPTHLYTEEGVYTITLDVTSPFGCHIEKVWEDYIAVLPSPIADFSFTPEQVNNFDPLVQFTDESSNTIRWEWNFNGLGTSFDPNPTFPFVNTGPNLVQLTVWASSGCIDTASAIINVIPEIRFQLPNAFTPNGDGVNDLYFGNGNANEAEDFMLAIWNRYGEKIFETNDPKEGWNGRKNNVGENQINDVYIVTVTYKDFFGEVIHLNGFATVIR